MLLVVTAMICFSLSDALVQHAGPGLSPARLAWLRYCLLLLTTLPLVSLQPRLWRARCPWLQALRALGLVGSAVLFLQGLKLLPIAEATALVFASPIYITLLAALLHTAGAAALVAVLVQVLLQIAPHKMAQKTD